MAEKKQSKGRCMYCEGIVAKGSMARHLATCSKRLEAIANAGNGNGETQTLYHLRVRDAYQDDYWLDLEMPGSKTLKALDSYLRRIWLECCGHLSQFTTKGWRGTKIPMSRTIDEVFEPGLEITHIYDFGTSSETLIKNVSVREGKPTTTHPIALMARNLILEPQCIECGRTATHLCLECVIDHDEWGVLCDEHAKSHPHEDYGEPIELVNSPRLGMCGYTGPAEAPY